MFSTERQYKSLANLYKESPKNYLKQNFCKEDKGFQIEIDINTGNKIEKLIIDEKNNDFENMAKNFCERNNLSLTAIPLIKNKIYENLNKMQKQKSILRTPLKEENLNNDLSTIRKNDFLSKKQNLIFYLLIFLFFKKDDVQNSTEKKLFPNHFKNCLSARKINHKNK